MVHAPPSDSPAPQVREELRPTEWLFRALAPAEQDLLLDLCRCSGSLKALAKQHGVSYPTIRTRLDRLIKHLKVLEAGEHPDPMAIELAELVEQGLLPAHAAKHLLQRHRQLLTQEQAST